MGLLNFFAAFAAIYTFAFLQMLSPVLVPRLRDIPTRQPGK